MLNQLIVKVPLLNGLGKSRGAEKAPERVINLVNPDIKLDVREVILDKLNISESFNIVSEKIRMVSNCIILGGDHSLTFASCKAFAEKYRKAGLVIFDSHPDCVNDFIPPTNEDFVRTLIEQKIIQPENVFIIGLRAIDPIEHEYMIKKKINFFTMRMIDENGIENVCDEIMESLRRLDAFYLSIDIDVLDPAFAPGTSYPEPSGMTTRELFYFIRRLKLLQNLKLADIVEINPERDINDITSLIGAKIIEELIKK